MPTVFVIGADWKLRGAVRAELRELGVEALGMESLDDAAHAMAGGSLPDAAVLDVASCDPGHPAFAELARRASLLVVTSGIEPLPPLPAGAELMRRPVRVAQIVARVRQMLEGRAA
jgi:DNA-binding response OmpR family regulator